MTEQNVNNPADAATWRAERFTRCSAADLVLIGLIVGLSGLAAWFGARRGAADSAPGKAVLYANERRVQEIDLATPGRFAIDGGLVVEVRDGKVAIVEADCPNQVCVKTGWIRRPGEVIACVPNKVLVEVEASRLAQADAIVR